MRELNYTVGIDSVDPSGILFGGQQGEHNATKIIVALNDELVSALADCNNYRFEAEDGAGARRIIAKDTYNKETSLSCLIPQYVTSSGGTVTVYLVFVQTGSNGETDGEVKAEKICWSVAMRMRFESNISDSGYSDDEGIDDVQLLVEECKTSAMTAQNAQSAAETAKEAAETVKENVENLLNDAETGLASKVDKSQIVSKISYPTDIPNGGAVLALGEDLIRSNSVSSIEKQSLSDAQKAQARSNIGALSSSDLETALADYVDTDELEGALSPLNQYRVSVLDSQEFSEAEKALGRSNIGAVSQEELSNGLEGKVDTSLITQDLASTGKDTIPTGNAVYEIVNNLIELNSVSSIVEQSLSDSQKSIARNNIGAASAEDVSFLQLAVEHLSEISWRDIQFVVRVGKGPLYFPVGYEFTTLDSDTGVYIVWVVRGHDHHTPANSQLTHSMTIEMKYVYSNASGSYKNLQFDASEALYYAEDGLAAGTYNFTLLAGYDTDYGGGKTLSFTLATPVPAGGVIMFPWVYLKQSTDMKISTYTSNASTSAIESVSVTEGNEGTSLGTADGTTENMNHTRRIRFGSNNYAQSAVRQWLNSSAAAGGVWSPTNKFDRTPTWAATYNGFMHGLPSDFLEVVQPAVIPCYTNPVFEVNSFDGTEFTANQVYTLTDKFFLLSRPEIFGTWDSTAYKDGEQLEYYEGLTDTERIKYDAAGSARTCWLRSPIAVNTVEMNYERYLSSSGTLSRDHANNSTHGVAPACIIA